MRFKRKLVFAICMFYGYLLIMVYLSWRIPGKKARSMAVMLVVMIAFILPPLMYMVGLLDIYTNIRQRIIEEIKKKGIHVKDFDRKEFHLLVTSCIEALFQTVTHGFSREEALHFAATVSAFYTPAWSAYFGM